MLTVAVRFLSGMAFVGSEVDVSHVVETQETLCGRPKSVRSATQPTLRGSVASDMRDRRCSRTILAAESNSYTAFGLVERLNRISAGFESRFPPARIAMSLRLAWSASLSGHRFDATVGAVKSFGAVCREVRTGAGLTQKEVAQAGDLEQSRVSEIERGRYTPGLDLAARLAKGLGVPLTELVARWEGLKAESHPWRRAAARCARAPGRHGPRRPSGRPVPPHQGPLGGHVSRTARAVLEVRPVAALRPVEGRTRPGSGASAASQRP